MPYLYLVRHAQPDFAGNYDSVTGLGLEQSRWLGEHFAARGLQFVRAISGSLQRQRSTLEAMAAVLPGLPAAAVDARFNEYDAATVMHFLGESSDAALRATGDRRKYFLLLRSALLAWASHEGKVPRGETWPEFGARIRSALDDASAGLGTRDAVLIVTSGGVIGRTVADTLSANAEAAIQLNLQTRNTGVTELARGRSSARVVSFNAVPHLERPDREHAVTHS